MTFTRESHDDTTRSSHGMPAHRRALGQLRRWFGLCPGAQPAQDAHSVRALVPWAQRRAKLFRRAEDLVRRAGRDRTPLAVVLFDLHDLSELEDVFGARMALQAAARTNAGLAAMTRRGGFAFRADLTAWVAILPDVHGERALELVAAQFGDPCCVEMDVAGEELVLVPELAVRDEIDRTTSFASLYDALCREVRERRAREQKRREWLERERESHTRPQGLPMPSRGHVIEMYPRIPPTIAMPLMPQARLAA